ncbi:putative secreted protein (Por secretion system target) [Flavobacterium tiangeerense]|uniref:Secreted protein (Por secretion system target) n=1 Tax=Flavobacterium tiangeerense TaxID=459471 RepID=A0ABY3FLG7_9FLAO|nr:T9SS type A sorting domain-containing protein [Flavobacterium tiangeerense]TWI01348.1 putative secreted protein (Por secretion system target) [Flavobacterium tiangeerense]
MKKFFSLILLFTGMFLGFAQSDLSWQGYFSYSEIKDISQAPNTVFAASENALFSKNTGTNIIKTTTTVDGLSGETISTIYHSTALNKTVVGYENGLIIVINEQDGSMLRIVDIINKKLSPTIKKINHFLEHQGILYVSCDFGIVQFNLSTMQFGDTYFIGDGGTEMQVHQMAFFNGYFYAATSSGIRRALATNPNLIDYNQWETLASASWIGITTLNQELYAVNATGAIQKYNAVTNAFVLFSQLPNPAIDMRVGAGIMVVSTPSTLYLYNGQMILLRELSANQIPETNITFTCATVIGDTVYIGTQENGLFTTALNGSSVFENSTPSGPLRNNIFALDLTPSVLWAVYGEFAGDYNPFPLDSYGISKYNKEGWLNIPYESVLGAQTIGKVIVNPINENQVYASSFFSGLLKIENDVPTILFNQTNSGLESLTFGGPNNVDIRINATAFDKSGNLWVTNSRIKNGLKVLRTNGQWQSYAMDKILDVPEENNYGAIVIDKNGTKWLATSEGGVVGFNENGAAFKKMTVGADTGNLPISNVRTVALDTRSQLWIGTSKGLRVLNSVNNFLSDTPLKANPVIIIDDNLPQELLFEQFITSIVVDGANNKWIGTADAGLFLVSPNGQETKYHFTTSNSPLPSNTINDIDINGITGEVFIATSKGMISFKGVATKANDDLSKAYVYPNPVRPDFQGTVKIAGLLDKANVKITDVGGNLVYETTSEGGTIEWDTTAFGKYKVASGVYMIFISAQDGVETTIKKVMIIR